MAITDELKAQILRYHFVEHWRVGNETPQQRIVQVLADAQSPLSQRQIRERAATRHTTVGTILGKLVREGRVEHHAAGGYKIVDTATHNCTTPNDAANTARHPDALRFPVPGSPIP